MYALFLPLPLQQRSVYSWVIDDVANNLKEDFRNEGVDLQVLNELKQVGVCSVRGGMAHVQGVRLCVEQFSISVGGDILF